MDDNRIDDQPSFRRGGGPGPHALENTNMSDEERGGFGHPGQEGVPGGQVADPGVTSSALAGNPHSVGGFRRAIESQQHHPSNGRGAQGSRLLGRVRNFAQARGPKFMGGGAGPSGGMRGGWKP